MKRNHKKLSLHRETLRALVPAGVQGARVAATTASERITCGCTLAGTCTCTDTCRFTCETFEMTPQTCAPC